MGKQFWKFMINYIYNNLFKNQNNNNLLKILLIGNS